MYEMHVVKYMYLRAHTRLLNVLMNTVEIMAASKNLEFIYTPIVYL